MYIYVSEQNFCKNFNNHQTSNFQIQYDIVYKLQFYFLTFTHSHNFIMKSSRWFHILSVITFDF